MDFTSLTADDFATLSADAFASLSVDRSSHVLDFISLTAADFCTLSADAFASLPVEGPGELFQPTILSVTTFNGGYFGGVVVRYRAFSIAALDLDPNAAVRLFVEGQDAGLGAVQQDGSVLFMEVVLPLGVTNLSIRQELGDVVSQESPVYSVRVNSEENVSVFIQPPRIEPDGGTFFQWPVTVTLSSDVAGTIFYCVDGTGYSRPLTEYNGPFKLYQTGVVKAKVRFNRVRSFVPIESAVVKQTIRIVR